MKRILVFIIALITFSVVIYLSINVFRLSQELTLLKKENWDSKKALEQNKVYILSLQKQTQDQLKKNVDELIIQQKTEPTPANKNESGISISARETIQSKDARSIAFSVTGSEKDMFDAMDLGLTFSNMKASPTCTTGDVFSQYPLVETTEKYLTITGIANISIGNITTGAINKRFVSCQFEKKDTSQSATVELDPAKTHIYSLGKPVLNLENSFKKSVW